MARTAAEIEFLKAEMPAQVASGRSLAHVLNDLRVSWAELTQWRNDDPAFHAALSPADRTHVEPVKVAPHARYTPEEVAFFKDELVERIAGGSTQSQAATSLGLHWSTVKAWRTADPVFDELLKAAIEYLTEMKADSLTTIHEDLLDTKVARLASDNLKTWLGWRNKAFAPKQPEDNGNSAQLADIIRGALNRLIEHRRQERLAAPTPLPVIDLQPSADS